jgi:hypothetical protein
MFGNLLGVTDNLKICCLHIKFLITEVVDSIPGIFTISKLAYVCNHEDNCIAIKLKSN